jgi:hypothetical protein
MAKPIMQTSLLWLVPVAFHLVVEVVPDGSWTWTIWHAGDPPRLDMLRDRDHGRGGPSGGGTNGTAGLTFSADEFRR